MRRILYPTDQSANASSAAAGTVTNDAQADPAIGAHTGVTLTVTATYNNDLGDNSSTRYTLDGVSYTTIRSVADNGGVDEVHTDTVSLGAVDLTLLAVQARAISPGGGGTNANVTITAWYITYNVPGGIMQAE